MKPAAHPLVSHLSTALAGWMAAWMCASGAVFAQDGGSAPGADLILSELEFALETAHRRIADLEALQAEQEEGDVPLESALAAANREAEEYRIRYRDLLVRVESLGLDTVGSERALQDRLIKAVRERQQFAEKQQAAMEQLMGLSEAVLDYLKTASNNNPDARLRLEAQLRKTDEALGFGLQRNRLAANEVPEINQGRIVSYKKEFELAVLNVGRRSGVRVGMPLNIFRKDRLVGTALIVDVRDEICGAVVQDVFREGDRVQVQDRIEPRTSNTIKL